MHTRLRDREDALARQVEEAVTGGALGGTPVDVVDVRAVAGLPHPK